MNVLTHYEGTRKESCQTYCCTASKWRGVKERRRGEGRVKETADNRRLLVQVWRNQSADLYETFTRDRRTGKSDSWGITSSSAVVIRQDDVVWKTFVVPITVVLAGKIYFLEQIQVSRWSSALHTFTCSVKVMPLSSAVLDWSSISSIVNCQP